jgi:hypothetical protein
MIAISNGVAHASPSVVKNIDSAEKNITPALITRFARSVHEFSRVEFHPCSGETSTAVEIACIAVNSAKLCPRYRTELWSARPAVSIK